jgi:hypothetical protein
MDEQVQTAHLLVYIPAGHIGQVAVPGKNVCKADDHANGFNG